MGMLAVAGAELYYEAVGSGPALLLIHGGNGDLDIFGGIAGVLADRFRVISIVRRGFERSPLPGPVDDDKRLATDAEDASEVIAALTDGQAAVFGSSSGAIVGLELLTRHPDRVRRLVCHEPPAVTLLPDGPELIAFFDDVVDTYETAGVAPAMAKFMAGVGFGGGGPAEPPVDLPPEIVEAMARGERNMRYWLSHEVRPYPRYVPDLDALAALAGRLVLAGGVDSVGQLAYRPNEVLAARLGLSIEDFPGGHAGYAEHPAEFAARLADALADDA